MTKIAIISQAEQGVLIDISGCSSLNEAKQYLTSTLQVSSQFWEGLIVDLNLGPLVLTAEQVNEIQAIVSEVGVQPRQIYSLSPITRTSLLQCRLPLAGHKDPNLVQSVYNTYSDPANSEVDAEPEDSEQTENIAAAQLITAAQHLTAAQSIAAALPKEREEPEFPTIQVLEASNLQDMEASNLQNPEVQAAELESTAHARSSRQILLPGEDLEDAQTNAAHKLPSLFLAARAGQQSSIPSINPFICDPEIESHTLERVAQGAKPTAQTSKAGSQTAKVPQAAAITAAQTGPRAVKNAAPAVLMMKQTLRSGQRVSHKGHLVIIGDVNPGAELVADGDITVWGALRGMAHAGASGNNNAEIRALKFEPIQLRIAQAIARSPDRNKPAANNMTAGPETARVVDGKIRISGSEPE